MQLPLQITARNISLSEVAEDDIRDKAAGLDHDDDGIMSRRNSVLHRGFERLEIGTEVRFAEEEGEQGPQASTVAIVGTRGLRAVARGLTYPPSSRGGNVPPFVSVAGDGWD